MAREETPMSPTAIAWMDDLDAASRKAADEKKLVLAHFYNPQ